MSSTGIVREIIREKMPACGRDLVKHLNKKHKIKTKVLTREVSGKSKKIAFPDKGNYFSVGFFESNSG